ncbi:MAG: hypothetical protein IKE41_05235 [Clostridia bacterium]|nr:hypothetical protein [Clostridia bacterium]MBR2735503.1 hypothetical protein [Clostridia bacterium]
MKNFLKICACFMCIFVFSGCKKILNNDTPSINTEINSSAVIEYNGEKYEAKIVRLPEGTANITFTSPENLSDVVFSWDGDKFEISRKNLVGTFTENPFAKNSIFGVLKGIFETANDMNNLKKSDVEEGETVYEGMAESKKFLLTVDNSGKILVIEVPDENLSIRFE